MKKLFAFISILAVMATAAFAEVTAKKNADGSVEVTFFYGNPRASEVLLAGDFTNWQDGALPMEKGDKGFSLTKTFKASDVLTYKFISDGNWTTDLRAPEFVDDGFGGKNSRAELADLIGGGDDAAAGKAKINFVSWTMLGAQGQFRTAKATDASKKGIDLDNATVGFKSYDKFTGNFLPNAPFFIELAVSETELDPVQNEGKLYLFRKDNYDNEVVSWEDGLKGLVNGLTGNPVSYLARSTNNSKEADEEDKKGPGTNPFLGHLKFGWNTPYINYKTGFNYAKPDAQKNILWTTVDGSNWDAGYQHVGGFNQFSLGDKTVALLEDATGLKFNAVFAPNKSADRKGEKYGLWSILGVSNDAFAAEVQYNSFYAGDYLFYKPFEHDVIVGGKTEIAGVKIAAQMLVNFYENLDYTSTKMAESAKVGVDELDFWKMMDFFGYSRSAIMVDDEFDFAKDAAGEVNVAWKNDIISLVADYRFRGWESNMLYVHDHHCDNGKDTQRDQLGTLNSQKVTLDATVTPFEELSINVVPSFETQFSTDDWASYYAFYSANSTPNSRVDMNSKDSKRIVGYVKVDYNLENLIGKKSAVSAYGKVKYNTEDEDKFKGYDSKFLFANAGLKFGMSDISDVLTGIDVYYGLNNTNADQMWNTLVAEAKLAGDMKVDLAFGLRTATSEYDGDVNNPFGFGVGFAKQFKKFMKPTVYAQFVYDMDPFKNFGDGQDGLNLDGYEIGDKTKASGPDTPAQDAVNVYEGTAAVRVGIRWDI